MYKNNFVLAVKVGGKVAREFNNSVYLPFGSEYSILLKNLSSQRARVEVFIDGSDALDGSCLIVDAGQDIDLKRFIKNGNLNAGNSFKFIEKTAAIEAHRGNKAEDGLITIKYEFENEWKNLIGGSLTPISYSDSRGTYSNYDQTTFYSATLGGEMAYMAKATARSAVRGMSAEPLSAVAQSQNTAGITAPGSINEQKFVKAGHFFASGVINTMTLQMQGEVEKDDEIVQVTQPVTVQRLQKCSMCGAKVRQTDKFCSQCGASVEIV